MYINNAEMHKVLKVHLHKIYATGSKCGVGSIKGPDELILSPKATEMQQIKQAITDLPEMRTGMVQDLKLKVQSGAYDVDEQEVADGMLAAAIHSMRKA